MPEVLELNISKRQLEVGCQPVVAVSDALLSLLMPTNSTHSLAVSSVVLHCDDLASRATNGTFSELVFPQGSRI